MSENLFNSFASRRQHDHEYGLADERQKRPRMSKRGGKVDVRSFLPRASVAIPTPVATSATTLLGFQQQKQNEKMKEGNVKQIQMPAANLDVPDLTMGSGRWTPADDLLLAISVAQVNDLEIVHKLSKFSCKFSLIEVQTRWNALLYNEYVSALSAAGIKNLHPEQSSAIHANAPFSTAEEKLLSELPSLSKPTLEEFQHLLAKNSFKFYGSRTAKCLQKHWNLMKQYELLCDQPPKPKKLACDLSPPPNCSDIDDDSLIDSNYENAKANDDPVVDTHVNQELRLWDKQIKYKIRLLEDENEHRQQLLKRPGVDLCLKPQFGIEVFALLHGRSVRYEMRKRIITFGRQCAHSETLDLDLSMEGNASKISRFQGNIELCDKGIFWIRNFGKYPFFVNGKSVLPNHQRELPNNAVIEILRITLIFIIHKQFVRKTCSGRKFNKVMK